MSHSPEEPVIALVTGATAGLGYETARLLAGLGNHVIVHGPTADEAGQAVERMIKDGADALHLTTAVADFSRLTEVATMARNLAQRHPRLDVLVNNAAIAGPEHRTLTEDGHERTWQVNYLAAYLLTRMLGGPLAGAGRSRVVAVSSSLHRGANLERTDLNGMRRYSRHAAYAQSKLALTMFMKALAETGPHGLSAVAVHPGILETALLRVYSYSGRPAREAARLVARLCLQKAVVNGGYYDERGVTVRPASVVANMRAVERLWKLSARLTGLE
jgi:NAD(P)-dependent dehydrogenase (short-subunit alcohol dehydrogenase family)